MKQDTLLTVTSIILHAARTDTNPKRQRVPQNVSSLALRVSMKCAILVRLHYIAAVVFFAPVLRAEDTVSFRQDIAPILMNKCIACHGPKKAEGGYRVDSFERAVKDGESGSAAFEAGSLERSEVFRRITSDDIDERMPLKQDALSDEKIALFKHWIEQGARFDGEDPKAELVSIIPPPTHPPAPVTYRFTVPITALVFSSDGKSLIAGGYHELTVWNPENGKLLRRISNVGQRTYALALSPDGNTLAVACGEPGRLGEMRLFDPENGELLRVFGSSSDVMLDAVFSPQGDRLAVATTHGTVRIFEVATGKQQLTITGHSDWIMAVAWNGDGSNIASASRDKTVKVSDAETGKLLVTYAGHGRPVNGVVFHPEGGQVFSSGADNKVHRWQIADAKKTAEIRFGGELFKLLIAGEFLFAVSADKTVRQFEVKTHKQLRSLTGHKDWPLSVAYHAGTRRLASGGFDGEVLVWNVEDGKPAVTFIAAPGQSARGQPGV